LLSQELEKAKTPQQIKFENEQSERLFSLLKEGKEDDVFNFLNEKRRIERLTSASVNDANIAAEIIKTAIQKKYSDLTPEEVERKFQREFSVPAKPEQGIDETDDEYEVTVSKWQEQKRLAEMDMIIEAKSAKRDLDSLKTDIRLPDIPNAAAKSEPTQEDLQKASELRKRYESELESAYRNFNGFNVTAKSEDAELPVAFVPTEQEKAALKDKLFDFEAADYLYDRWTTKEGVVDANRAMKDLYLLENAERIFQKIANETAAKTLEAYIKSRSNVSVNATGAQRPATFDQAQHEKEIEAIWAA